MNKLISFTQANHERYIRELTEYLAIPSISSDPSEKESMMKAAEHTAQMLRDAGCDEAVVHSTDKHPVVTGSVHVDDKLPTMLIYGHYDVQPIDPIELWEKDPFEAFVKGDYIIGRGSADDKGQVFIHIKAIEAYKLNNTPLPLNVKFIIEGEEEIGSPSLAKFMSEHKELLAADVAVVSDTAMWAAGMPAITYGLKGISYFEFELTGPNHDLHSGEYGGGVANPAEIIARMLAQVKDDQGRIQIPGFYDDVRDISDDERALLARIPYKEAEYKAELDVDALWGEEGYTHLERVWTRPTFEINGIWGGFIGTGSKTVLPSKAAAKVSMRLVPDQDPHEMMDKAIEFIKSITPPTMKIDILRHEAGLPFLTELDSPYIRAGAHALKETFDREPLMIRGGGSIPIVTDMKNILDLEVLLVGYCLPTCRAHSPNENLHLPSFFNGIESQVRMMKYISEIKA